MLLHRYCNMNQTILSIKILYLPLLLNIDTATEYASVCITRDEEVLAIEVNEQQQNHASFLQPAIKKIFDELHTISLAEIDAVAVTAGPGSYTGLRVALASAKGLCFVLNKPLILINTLEVMALAAIEYCRDHIMHIEASAGFCPMIDARRMEVFAAMYDDKLQLLFQPAAVLLDIASFKEWMNTRQVFFSGNGAKKFSEIVLHENARFIDVQHHAGHLAKLAVKAYRQKYFADIAYSEPLYLKEFFTPAKTKTTF